MNIGGAIGKVRKQKKISQGDLAKLANLNQSYLSQIENNKKTPNVKTIAEIAKALDVPVSMLFLFSINENEIPEKKRDVFNALMPVMESLFDEYYIK